MSEQTVGTFLKTLNENDALRNKFSAAVPDKERSPANVVAFATTNGFDFTEEDLEKVYKSFSTAKTEALSDNELEAVAGGIIIVGGSFSTSLLRSLAAYSIQRAY